MSILVFTEIQNGAYTKNAFEAAAYAVKLASQLQTQAVAIACGPIANPEAIGEAGIQKVLHASAEIFTQADSGVFTKALKAAAEKENASLVVLSHDFTGKAVAPRLAAALKAGLVSGAVDLPETSEGFIVKKAVFSGKAFAHVVVHSDKKVISLLPNSYAYEKGNQAASVEAFSPETGASAVKVLQVTKASTQLSLTEADLVVSAGRGLKGPENWGMVEELAKLMGAATACSRPVADIGWRPHHEHVGQTGTAIRPNLYIAIGISGAIQHLAGVNGSKVIVVINTDAEAPFFKAADYGIVGDAFQVMPKIIEAYKNFKASNN